MSSRNGDSASESDEYRVEPGSRKKTRKRRKISDGRVASASHVRSLSLDPLLYPTKDAVETSFDEYMLELLPEYLQTRAVIQEREAEIDSKGQKIRPLTRSEELSWISYLESNPSPSHAILLRKLKLNRERRRLNLSAGGPGPIPDVTTPLSSPQSNLPVKSEVLDALDSIETTPFENSFLSRILGATCSDATGLIAVDWETKTPWMDLMSDIREHYSYAHPEREQPAEGLAPITYMTLQANQLPQAHELLERTFWSGVNVSDSLEHSPERCTVIATYKKVVVGVAILSSPQETYITYLAVKAGWNNSHIARTMLYHLIVMNPYKDITLHVSTDNPAMMLYNLFGFKAEEFVAGFYEDYLDSRSRSSKNAFRLRLRQQHIESGYAWLRYMVVDGVNQVRVNTGRNIILEL